MALTAGGLPYPLGTEPVRDGDNAIKALADALQLRGYGLKAQYGRVDPAVTGGNYSLVYPVAFSSPPLLFLVQSDVLAANKLIRAAVNNTSGGVDATRAVLYITNDFDNAAFTGNVILRWLAIGAV
jgi:hypothetical protein